MKTFSCASCISASAFIFLLALYLNLTKILAGQCDKWFLKWDKANTGLECFVKRAVLLGLGWEEAKREWPGGPVTECEPSDGSFSVGFLPGKIQAHCDSVSQVGTAGLEQKLEFQVGSW